MRPERARLLTVAMAADYLSLSERTIRKLILAGALPKVELALPITLKRKGGACRRVLVDREDLDRLILRSKERPS